MKILMVVSYFYNLVGGTQTLVREITRELIKRGHQVDILTVNLDKGYRPLWKKEIINENESKIIRWPSREPFGKIEYLNRIYHKFFNSVFILKPGLREIVKYYDLIQFYDVNDLSFPLSLLTNNIKKTFLCATLSERFSLYKSNVLPRAILKKSANIFLSSNINTTNILKELKINKEKIVDLPYGVDTRKFSPSGNSKEENLLLFAGAIEERKGLHILLQACKKLNRKINLIIAGPVRDEKYFNSIKPLIESIKKDFEHKIEYLNFVKEEQLINLYKKATLFICPSIMEEFGIVIIEAMACGTPVIASRIGGIPYVVKDLESGILVNPDDSIALSEKINMLLSDKETRLKMGIKAREYVLENFSLEDIVAKLEKIYDNLLSVEKSVGNG